MALQHTASKGLRFSTTNTYNVSTGSAPNIVVTPTDTVDNYIRLGGTLDTTAEANYLPSQFKPISADSSSSASGQTTKSEGIMLYTTGYYLLKVAGSTTETFGKGFVDYTQDAHDVDIIKGKWEVNVDQGKANFESNERITVTANGGDIKMRAWNGGVEKSDRRNNSLSSGNYITFILGLNNRMNVAFVTRTQVAFTLSINLSGAIFFKIAEAESKALKIGFGASTLKTVVDKVSMTLLGFKYCAVDGKRVLYYKKLTVLQFYRDLANVDMKAASTLMDLNNIENKQVKLQQIALGQIDMKDLYVQV